MKFFSQRLLLISLSFFLILSTGCKKTDSQPEGPHEHSHGEGDGHNHQHADSESTADSQDPKSNKELEPPVEISAVPKGAWYCDMGTVHYYQHEKGDGKCPICGMLLKEK